MKLRKQSKRMALSYMWIMLPISLIMFAINLFTVLLLLLLIMYGNLAILPLAIIFLILAFIANNIFIYKCLLVIRQPVRHLMPLLKLNHGKWLHGSLLLDILKEFFLFLWTLPILILGLIFVIIPIAKHSNNLLEYMGTITQGTGHIDQLIFEFCIFIFFMFIARIDKKTSYSQANFIYLINLSKESPISIYKAIKLSKKLMKYHKDSYYDFVFSFSGWFLLSICTFGLGFIGLVPYFELSKASYFSLLLSNSNQR